MSDIEIELSAQKSKQIGIVASVIQAPNGDSSPTVIVLIGEDPRNPTLPFEFSMLTPNQAIALARDLLVKAQDANALIKKKRRH